GIVLDGPTVPTSLPFINPEVDEGVEETLMDQDLSEYTIKSLPYLGRPFLRTARALIDVHGEEMILRDGDERLTLNMRHDTSSYSNQPQKESINLINVFNNSSEDFLEDLFLTNQPSGNPTFSHHELTSSEVKDNIFDPEGGNVLPEKLLDLDSTKDLHPPLYVKPLSGSTTYSSSLNQWLEEFADELALITFPPEYDDDLQFDIDSDLKEIEYLLYHDPIKDIDSSLMDSIDQSNLVDLNDNFVDSMPEMFTDEHALEYSSPSIFDEYDDDLFKVEFDTENVYDDPFDSKGEKIKESKLLIDELDLPYDFLPSSEYDPFPSEDFPGLMLSPQPTTRIRYLTQIGHIAPNYPQKTKRHEQSNLVEEDLEPTLLMAILEDSDKGIEVIKVEDQKVSLHEEDVGYTKTSIDSLWYLDNGASNHMTGVREHFKELNEKVSGKVRFGDGSYIEIKGIGSILIECEDEKQRIISHVYYIPSLKSNLLSLGQFTKIGCKVVMEDDKLQLYDMDNKIFMEVTRQRNRLYKASLRIGTHVCILANLNDTTWLWHARLGHLNFESLKSMAQRDLVRRIPTVKHTIQICDVCLIEKHIRAPFSKMAKARSTSPLDLVYGDLCGRITPPTPSGKKYIFLIVDDYSRYMWVYFLSTKDQAFDTFKEYKSTIEKELRTTLKMLRTDRGGEFTSNEFTQYCKENGIARQLTAPYSPQQNRVVERRNRTIIDVKFKEDETWDWSEYLDEHINDELEWKYFKIGNLDVTNEHHDQENQPNKDDDEFPNNDDDGYDSPITDSPSHSETLHTPPTRSSQINSQVTPNTIVQSFNQSDNDSTSTTNTHSNFDHTPIRGYRTLNDIYEDTEELLLAEDEPKNYKEASDDQKWIEAMKVELDSINRNNTWELTTLPTGHKAIGLKWVFKTKKDANGNIIKHKARLVAKGYIQEHGIDFEEQSAYANKILKEAGMLESNETVIPMDPGTRLTKNTEGTLVNSTEYRSLIRCFRYLLHTRPDLSYSVGLLSRFMQEPKEQHMKAIKQVLRYVKGTKDYGITYKHNGGNTIQGFSNNSYGVNTQEGKGTIGIIFYYGDSPISWSTQKQATVALSSCESEFIVATAAATQALWLKRLLSRLTHSKEERSQ
nr:zinc finger, CCHC-type [Tanacetum cinerariifolium]